MSHTKPLPEITDAQAFQNTDREVWRETPGDFYSNSVHLTATGGLGINVGGTVYVKPPAEWHRLASGARSTALVALAPEVDDALREVGKWLNEQPNRPIDRVAVAVLCAALSCSTAAQPADRAITSDELKLITDLRWALGDNGKRMQPELVEYAREIKARADAAAQPVEPTGPWLDDEGRAMIANSHHYTAANIKAIVDELNCLSDPDRTPLSDIENKDLRTWFGVLARIITGLAHEVPTAPAASGDSTPASLEVHMDREHGGLAFGKGDPSGALRPEPEAVGQGRWWRKKPVVIEAFQWNGLESGCQAAKARFPELETSSKSGHLRRPEVTSWHIRTLEGHMRVSPGDWIVRGVAGEFYPCKPDIFAATYEPAEPPQAASVERGD